MNNPNLGQEPLIALVTTTTVIVSCDLLIFIYLSIGLHCNAREHLLSKLHNFKAELNWNNVNYVMYYYVVTLPEDMGLAGWFSEIHRLFCHTIWSKMLCRERLISHYLTEKMMVQFSVHVPFKNLIWICWRPHFNLSLYDPQAYFNIILCLVLTWLGSFLKIG